jgi:nucleoside-triphosphatase
MMHILLTGEIQIGKSTVIKKTLSLLNLPYGGFCTYFGPDRANPDRYLYINDAAAPPSYGALHVVARFQDSAMPEAYPERFNTLGVQYISEARQKARLIILDECGSLEWKADAFQNEILSTLEGSIPVLGVIKLSASGWVDKLRHHPNVTLITVDQTNRNTLPPLLSGMLNNACGIVQRI